MLDPGHSSANSPKNRQFNGKPPPSGSPVLYLNLRLRPCERPCRKHHADSAFPKMLLLPCQALPLSSFLVKQCWRSLCPKRGNTFSPTSSKHQHATVDPNKLIN